MLGELAENAAVLDTLRSFTEVGVAIAGFTAVASALKPSLIMRDGSAEHSALVAILETAGLVVFFSLLPQILQEAPIEDASRSRASMLAYGLLHAVHAYVIVRRNRRVGSAIVYFRVLEVCGFILINAQILLAVVGDIATIKLIYLVALTWHTAIAALSFGGAVTTTNQSGGI